MFKKIFKTGTIMIVSILLTTLTIDATDNMGNFSDSMLGNTISALTGKEKGACPEGMVFVETDTHSFCIDAYEASASDECIYAVPQTQGETQSNIEQKDCVAVSKKDAIPWTNVARQQATLLCAKTGKRLATAKEWYSAALGTPDSSPQCALEKIGQQGPDPTGSHDQCMSFTGAHDMVGNVWEWVSDTVRNGSYEDVIVPNSGYVHAVDEAGVAIETDPKNPDPHHNEDRFWSEKSQVTGMFRGGFWGSEEDAGIYSVHAQMSPSFVGKGVGFRCVQ
jgi:formylglycine-generating enzyme required for sulfatase activity